MKKWNYSEADKNGKYIGIIEFQDNSGEYQDFVIMKTDRRLVFGSACNVGFIESGYMEIDDCFSLDENLEELLSELETYYSDGSKFTSKIVCNERL